MKSDERASGSLSKLLCRVRSTCMVCQFLQELKSFTQTFGIYLASDSGRRILVAEYLRRNVVGTVAPIISHLPRLGPRCGTAWRPRLGDIQGCRKRVPTGRYGYVAQVENAVKISNAECALLFTTPYHSHTISTS